MTSGLPDISVAERLADRIVALRSASRPEAVRRKCDDLLIDVVFVRGGVGLDAFTDAAVREERVCALAAKVRYRIDPDNPYPNSFTGHIRAGLEDGSVVEERQPHLRGGAGEPLSREDVEERFIRNVRHGGWFDARGDAALKMLYGLFDEPIDLQLLRG